MKISTGPLVVTVPAADRHHWIAEQVRCLTNPDPDWEFLSMDVDRALSELAALADEGVSIAAVAADWRLPGCTGLQFLHEVHQLRICDKQFLVFDGNADQMLAYIGQAPEGIRTPLFLVSCVTDDSQHPVISADQPSATSTAGPIRS